MGRQHRWGVLLYGFLLLLLSCSREEPTPIQHADIKSIVPADDRSLTPDEYLKMGMPSPDRMWSPLDYGQASKVLKTLIDKDPCQLPRYESGRSGKMFDRIRSPENLAISQDQNLQVETRMSLTFSYLENLSPILQIYLTEAEHGKNFDAEIVEIMGLMLEISQKSQPLAAQFMASLPKDDPQLSVRQAGFEKMKAGTITTFTGAIDSVEEVHFYRAPARVRLCEYLQETLPQAMRNFPPSVQKELSIRLEKMSENESDENVKKALAKQRK